MAPSRGKGKKPVINRESHRQANAIPTASDGIPDVYQTLLSENPIDQDYNDSDRPLKKRRTAAQRDRSHDSSGKNAAQSDASPSVLRKSIHALQTVEASSDSDASDFEFEDVDLEVPAESEAESVKSIEDISITVQPGSDTAQATPTRRKPISRTEKAHRLLVHKVHILCLLSHCMYVNGRCNNHEAQRQVSALLSTKTRSYLNPRADDTQFQRNRSFMDGLQQALDAFVVSFSISASGLRKSHWQVDGSTDVKADTSETVDKADFIDAASSLHGSQDLGNQLFCALLRSAGVEARLVCSLQPLPFVNAPKPPKPPKAHKGIVLAIAPDRDLSASDVSADDTSVRGSTGIGKVPAARRRLGQLGSLNSHQTQASPTIPRPSPRKIASPVFWVEAFNAAQQKWIPIDPMVTHTINKPYKLEPSLSYEQNQMMYVVAFEQDGVARDTTKRYAKAYNAKTRRHRVEASGEDGMRWWRKVMRYFRRRNGTLDRDQVEDAELAQKEAREGLPTNILDFKGHPYYALERHLKRHEVIHPKQDVGKVNAGTPAKPRMEPVYRRQHVLVCKSADKWYRLGRVVKEGEQPLKLVSGRARRKTPPEGADAEPDSDAADTSSGLYSIQQTELYTPAPVVRGRIPKNAYGNLDVYVPSMVPAGGTHVRHSLGQRAAKLLRVDFADAVTGFSFKGRHGTAIIDGVVVAEQFGDAIKAVIEGFEADIVEDESRLRSLEALRLWKRFLTGLRIAERVSTYGDTSSAQPSEQTLPDMSAKEVDFAGGFIPNQSEDTPLPTAGKFSIYDLGATKISSSSRKRRVNESESGDDDALSIEDVEMRDAQDQQDSFEGEGGFMVEEPTDPPSGFIRSPAYSTPIDYNESGGFLVEEDEDHYNDSELFKESSPLRVVRDEDLNDPRDRSQSISDSVYNAGGEGEMIATQTESTNGKHEQDHDEMEQDMTPAEVDVEKANLEQSPVDEVEATNPSEDHSDKGSLLSHDPDDDDAEPDWLESD